MNIEEFIEGAAERYIRDNEIGTIFNTIFEIFDSVEACDYVKKMILNELESDIENRVRVYKKIFKSNETVMNEFREKMMKMEKQDREVTEWECCR